MRTTIAAFALALLLTPFLWAETAIVDHIYNPDGTGWNGTIELSLVDNTYAPLKTYAGWKTRLKVVNGVLPEFSLAPNSTLTPAGTRYRAVYSGVAGTKTEYWIVPDQASASLREIRTTSEASPPDPGLFAGGDLTGQFPNPTLKASGVSAGTYGDATHTPQITVDAKGRITAAVSVPVEGGGSGAVSSVFGRTGAVIAQTGDYSFSQISGTVANSQIAAGVDAAKIGSGTVSNTVFGYLANVVSDIQAQINAKAPTLAVLYADSYCAVQGTYDHTCLNNAIAAAGNYSTIQLGSHAYTLGAQVLLAGKTGVSIRGVGDASRLVAANGLNLDVVKLSSCSRCSVSELQIDGNKANQTSGYALYLADSAFAVVSGVYVHDGKSGGVRIASSGTPQDESRVLNSYIQSNGGNGLEVEGSNDHIIAGNHIDYNASSGVLVSGGYNVSLVGNNLLTNSAHGIFVYGGGRHKIQENAVRNNNGHGIVVQMSKDNLIAGNLSHMNSQGSAGTYSGIVLDSTATTIVANNVSVDVDFDPKHQAYGLLESGTTDGTVVVGNRLAPNLAGAAALTGSNTISSNAGVTDNTPLSGDVTGTVAATTVGKLQGRAVASTAPSDGQSLVWNGANSQWQPQTVSGSGLVSSVFGRTGAVVAQTGDYSFSQISGTASNSQIASGVDAAKIGSGTVSNTAFGYLANVTSDIQNQLNGKAATSHTHTLGGDVTGDVASTTVGKLQGRNVASTAPSDAQALVWSASNNQWQPATVSGSGATMASALGDLTVRRDSATQLTIGPACSASTPCNIRFGSTTTRITASAVVTLTSGTGTAYIYVTPSGALTVGHNVTLACNANCTAVSGVTTWPADVIPLWRIDAVSNAWDTGGGLDFRAFLANRVITTGVGLSMTGDQITVDSASVPFKGAGYAASKAIATNANGDLVAVSGNATDCVLVNGTSAACGGSGSVTSVFGRTGAVVSQTGDYTAAQVTNAADKTAANTYSAGAKQTMQPSATTAGLNVASGTLPSSPATGDIAVDSGASNFLKWYAGTGWKKVGTLPDPGANGLLARTATDTLSARTITGTANHITVSNGDGVSGNPTLDLAANAVASSFGITIDGGGSAITTGQKGFVRVPYACTIAEWTLLADQSGSAVVDIWKNTMANFPPTVADTITASAKPTLSSQQGASSTTLTGWTTAVSAGDVIGFNVDSASTITRLTLAVRCTR